jgi:hypothetical protein
LQLTGDYLAAEVDYLQVRRSHLAEVAEILPERTVARFYQIENKMDAIVRYDLACTISVVEPAGGTPRKQGRTSDSFEAPSHPTPLPAIMGLPCGWIGSSRAARS